ncbi:MAG: crossover junction endodeoxyribonuclease RuvC [Ruminococcaceae bacterium]|nr:crossover junction endodeoxyribonuclease RuvC [Oscillospiraceae bacterium]
MIILGIDPGIATVGYGVISAVNGKFYPIDYGTITTKAGVLLEKRLLEIYEGVTELIKRHSPDAVAIEELFFNKNVKTAIDVAQGRGAILTAIAKSGIDLFEYTPLQVKSSVVGYGRAEKQQVMYMIKVLLNLKSAPKPDDTADALAIAICHANFSMHTTAKKE